MIRTDKLRGLMAEKGLTQIKVANGLGITKETFYRKMKRGVFDSDEIDTLIDLLDIDDPCSIFFARDVTQ